MNQKKAPPKARSRVTPAKTPTNPAQTYTHPTAELLLRPDVGTQSQFRKKKPPRTYRYDSSLSPDLNWDGNPARALGEWLLAMIDEASRLPAPHRFDAPRALTGNDGRPLAGVAGLADAVEQLKRLAKPFLNWAGKAERLSFDVPTLPLFVHERLSTKAILETLKGHQRDKQLTFFDLFGDREHSIHDQVLRAYEHKNGWVNRMVLGDSLAVMNSLLNYEGLGGQVQCIYMDPPYGIKFGSNFQPFVRQRDVKHNDDADMTREPEMVKAYRDTWELGLHSYLTYMRDRLLLARELLHPSGSVFVQIGDENLHHVREVLDEVFGPENFISQITFAKTSSATTELLPGVADYILHFARDRSRVKHRTLFNAKMLGGDGTDAYQYVELASGKRMHVREAERLGEDLSTARHYRLSDMRSQRPPGSFPVEFQGRTFTPGRGYWKTGEEGFEKLIQAQRIELRGNNLNYIRYLNDFPAFPITNLWDDTSSTVGGEKVYAVQTNPKVVERCVLMASDPGDLVLDPTCGSGTTAYVAEQWGRRWITVDTSRVPLALARQRLLTATFAYYELKDEGRGPAGGFVYQRRQNTKGEEVGGIVPHVTLKSIANNEPPEEEVLVDRPEEDKKITRVTGPFCVEATIPTPADWEETSPERERGAGEPVAGARGSLGEDHGSFVDRMLEVLRRSPVLQLGGGKSVTLKNVRPPAKTLSLSAEAIVEGTLPGRSVDLADAVQESFEKDGHALPLSGKPVAIVFGPENGAISERLVYEAAKEAHAKQYQHVFVIGFAIQPNARKLIEDCEKAVGLPATYVQATPDLMMGDLLKNMRSSQIFSVCGLPDVVVRKADEKAVQSMAGDSKTGRWFQVELLGLDVFDPTTMETDPRPGGDVPAWFLDTDYNGLCFHVSQAFFPRTAAWDDLKRSLRAEFEPSVWEHLAGTVSAPFETGAHGQVAVKVIDDRGNELLVVKSLREAR